MGPACAAESVLHSPHFALVLSGLVEAGPCCAEPSQARGGGRGDEFFRKVQTCLVRLRAPGPLVPAG